METSDIKGLCINGSNQYLKYLTDNNKGRSEIGIHSITAIPKSPGVFKLELANRIFELDAIIFHHLPTGKEFDTAKLKVKEYDYDRNILFIKQEGVLPFDLKSIKADDIVIISDLKFLVQRILDFFRFHGERIKVPTVAANPSIKISDFEFQPDAIPDDSQKQALLSIFKNPVVYIWGAPGTGKTRFVLSHSVIHYIKQNKKVAIFAPTNVALEQVLSGVLSITDKANIKRERILRVGNPSRVFAAKYPEVCEVTGVQKKLEEINKQIAIIERITGVDQTSHDQMTLDKLSDLVKKIEPIIKQVVQLKLSCNNAERIVNESQKRIAVNEKESELVKSTIHNQEKRLTSVIHQIVKFFSSGLTGLEKRIEDLRIQYKSLAEESYSLNFNYQEQKESLKNLKSEKATSIVKQNTLFEQAKNLPFRSTQLIELRESFSIDNLKEKAKEAISIFLAQKEEEGITDELKKEYATYSSLSIAAKLDELGRQKEILEKLDTTERLKSVNVIAATFDGFVGRFPDADLKVDHLFIDEAGYANIIKALTTFVYDKPVTLLGDHYQLPPVSELNDSNSDELSDTITWTQSAIFCCNVFDRSKNSLIAEYENNQLQISNLLRKETLNKTHRFGSNLAKIINDFVYRNGFHSNLTKGDTKIRFINVPKGRPTMRRGNLNEIAAIKKWLSIWSGDIHSNSELAILAPYNEQIVHLGRTFPELRKDLRVLTVHKSQGREWNSVILSVCDTDNKWFTDTTNLKSRGLNLINTAVSRAKYELIIVCDYNYWISQRGQLIQGLLSVAEEVKL